MAAGRGTRISKFIGEKPKSLVDVGGITLLSHTIEMLKSNGRTSGNPQRSVQPGR